MVRCPNCFEQHDREYDICPHCGYAKGSLAAEPFYINPGTVLQNRYAIGMVLGYGGFGIIYKAWDKKLQTVVAIKEYFPSGIVNRAPDSMNVVVYAKKREMEFNHGFVRFVDEAKNMAKFGIHGNIVNVYGYFEENRTAYITMEYLHGVTLSEFLKTSRLDIEGSLSVVQNVCHALKTIHASGIIHRDVSPDNIFICSDNRIKLIDFGTARFSLDEEKMLTVILKPGYAPPEQYEKINVQGPWTDIYALGATLYLMLTGIKPDESTNRKINDTLAPPAFANPDIPENISNTIMQAMALDRHLRFKTIEEFEKGLNQEKKVMPLGKIIKKRKRRRFVTVMASALVVVFAVTAFAYSFNRQRDEETLRDARILVWYELTGNDVLDEKKTEAYAAIFDAFRESFPNIEMEVETYETHEYASRLQSALETGNPPTLFESTDIDASMLDKTIKLDAVVNRVLDKPDNFIDWIFFKIRGISEPATESKYYFLDDYTAYFPSRNRLPLGFTVPVVYINTTLSNITGNSIAPGDIDSGSREQFLAGETAMFLSDTLDFFDVQAILPARYRLLRIEDESISCSFANVWSIGECPENEKKAAERLLGFMFTDNAQDYLYIRNSTGALPLNKTDLATFMEVYMDFSGFFDNIDSYAFPAAN